MAMIWKIANGCKDCGSDMSKGNSHPHKYSEILNHLELMQTDMPWDTFIALSGENAEFQGYLHCLVQDNLVLSEL